ncbi:hypothetical protein FACS189429_3420 [Bacteroidia bacterium]|nr:hypothetical protein FACS189429_3420 [Bacteroidia bacterium]
MYNFSEILSQPIGKQIIAQLISEIETQPSDFQVLFNLIFKDKSKQEITVAWHAAWVIDHISRKHFDWFDDKMKTELVNFSQNVTKDGHLRLCLSILLNAGLPAEISGDFVNFCFQNIINEKTAVSVKALSIKLLAEICKTEPDLQNELKIILQNIDFQSTASGVKAAVKNVLSKLL